MSMPQPTIAETELAVQTALTRASLYRLLAKSFRYPTEPVLKFVRSSAYEDALQELFALHSDDGELQQHADSFAAARAQLCTTNSRDALEAEYNRLFAHLGSAKCPPYETEFGHENVFQKTDAMADIAGFYSAYGLEPSATDTERVDFISMELEFMSYVALHEAYAREHGESEHLEVCIDTQRKFLQDHLGRWVSVFSNILSNATASPFYTWLGRFTEYFIDSEARNLKVTLGKVAGPVKMESLAPESFGCDGCVAHEAMNEVRVQQDATQCLTRRSGERIPG